MDFWIIIFFLALPFESSAAWVNYEGVYPSKVFCQTFLRSKKSALNIGLKNILKQKNMENIEIDGSMCINFKEMKSLDKDQYINLYKPVGIST
jgi:hypothetical protein